MGKASYHVLMSPNYTQSSLKENIQYEHTLEVCTLEVCTLEVCTLVAHTLEAHTLEGHTLEVHYAHIEGTVYKLEVAHWR